MIQAAESTSAVPAAFPARQAPAPPPSDAPFSFHQLLSELNPLQYLPVIGTIYRAVTGDTIPEPVRVAGSMVVSGLTGGPIGMAVNVGMLGLEKATGFDPEKIGHQFLASLGLTPGEPAAPVETAAATAPQSPAPASEQGPAVAWSPSQLAAYGISVTVGGAMTRGGLSGSDVLNDLVLANLRPDLGGQPPSVQPDSLVG